MSFFSFKNGFVTVLSSCMFFHIAYILPSQCAQIYRITAQLILKHSKKPPLPGSKTWKPTVTGDVSLLKSFPKITGKPRHFHHRLRQPENLTDIWELGRGWMGAILRNCVQQMLIISMQGARLVASYICKYIYIYFYRYIISTSFYIYIIKGITIYHSSPLYLIISTSIFGQ